MLCHLRRRRPSDYCVISPARRVISDLLVFRKLLSPGNLVLMDKVAPDVPSRRVFPVTSWQGWLELLLRKEASSHSIP